jgi:hypothetical protein
LTVTAGSLKLTAVKGADSIYFDGLLSRGNRLRLGEYTVTIAAVDAARGTATARPLHFTIVK